MEKHEAILAELEQMREAAVAQMRASLDGVAGRLRELGAQMQERAGRAAAELATAGPGDPEKLFPFAGLAERLKELAAPVAAPAVALDVVRRLDAGRAQSEVLQELLRQLAPWAGPRAIVVLREGVVQGWASSGFPQGDPARSWKGNLADSAAISMAAEGKPVLARPSADKVLGGWFGGSGKKLLVVPMALRGKVVGLLLALEGEAGLDATVVQTLTYTVGLMLETLSGRTAVPTVSLLDPEDLTGLSAPEPVAEKGAAPDLFELEVAPTAPPPPPPVAAARPAPPPPPPRPMPPEIPDASATVQLKVPVAPAAPPHPVAPAPPPPAAPAAPGPARSPEEERKHEEAKRFARLLVSEIRLYNEQAVQAGKAGRDIYRRLKDDIDRSREMYEQRVSADVRAHSNYFQDEMVRILADGEPDALGM